MSCLQQEDPLQITPLAHKVGNWVFSASSVCRERWVNREGCGGLETEDQEKEKMRFQIYFLLKGLDNLKKGILNL